MAEAALRGGGRPLARALREAVRGNKSARTRLGRRAPFASCGKCRGAVEDIDSEDGLGVARRREAKGPPAGQKVRLGSWRRAVGLALPPPLPKPPLGAPKARSPTPLECGGPCTASDAPLGRPRRGPLPHPTPSRSARTPPGRPSAHAGSLNHGAVLKEGRAEAAHVDDGGVIVARRADGLGQLELTLPHALHALRVALQHLVEGEGEERVGGGVDGRGVGESEG